LHIAQLPRGFVQIPRLTTGASSASAYGSSSGVAGAAAVLNDASGTVSLGQQLNAYQSLASRWRDARPGERAVLAQALTESPFAQNVQSTLNTFTRAAWAGPDAVPPAPQIQILKAFDGLSDDQRRIVAAMQGGAAGPSATPSEYRARLQADLEAAQPAGQPRRSDTVTLSAEAQARLAAGEPPASVPTTQPDTASDPQMGRAIAAYARAAG
jgi:hypothetical protein